MIFRLKTDEEHTITVGAIEVQVQTPDGEPVAGQEYVLTLSDGSQRTGKLSAEGRLRESNIPPGTTASLRLTGIPMIALSE
jgi:hypothetical protein